MDESELPLVGKIFCCTAVQPELRNETIRCIEAMGGTHKVNLMSDVKYMIVGSRDTPKYEYAVQNRADIVFLRPSFIPDLFQRWQSADTLGEVESEIDTGKLQVFEGLRICCTNISEGRSDLIALINQHGGLYSPDLTKQVTHLISGGTDGRKYKFAKKWEVFTVHPEWINQSIRRGAALRENYFELELGEDRIGVGACKMWPDEYEKLQEEESEQIAPVPRRLKKRKMEFSQVWDSVLMDKNDKGEGEGGAALGEPHEMWGDRQMPKGMNNNNNNNTNRKRIRGEDEQENEALGASTKNKQQQLMFSGQAFQFVGYESSKLPILEKSVKSHGGTVPPKDSTDTISFCIVSSEMPPKDRPRDSLPSSAVIATEWMIERSIHKKLLLMDQWGLPLAHRDIPGMDCLNIHSSGFSGVEGLHLPKLIRLLGGKHQSTLECKTGLTNSTDIMVVSSEISKIGLKIKLCKRHGIPMVSEKWLFECADRGILAPLDSSEFVMFDVPQSGKIVRRRSVEQSAIDKEQEQDQDQEQNEPKPDSVRELSSKIQKSRPEKRKLVGRASTSNLNEPESLPKEESNGKDDEPKLTQVSYNDPETAKDHRKLMEALGTSTSMWKQQSEVKSTTAAVDNGRDRRRRLRNKA